MEILTYPMVVKVTTERPKKKEKEIG